MKKEKLIIMNTQTRVVQTAEITEGKGDGILIKEGKGRFLKRQLLIHKRFRVKKYNEPLGTNTLQICRLHQSLVNYEPIDDPNLRNYLHELAKTRPLTIEDFEFGKFPKS